MRLHINGQMTTLAPHRVRFIRDYLQNSGVERMEWPACGPDLNPIEQLWDQLGRTVHARVTKTTIMADLQQMLIEEWDGIPQQCVTKLVTSYIKFTALKICLSQRSYPLLPP
uniref:Tc1-like transposase DDE domain-containing protein n=1 Tax=Paramormyrops kingsleyae TaxID=1676925 RepID=A0A3B3QEN2_9TELE